MASYDVAINVWQALVAGAGKKTLALAVLREIFGPAVEKVKVEGKTWKLEQGDRKIEVGPDAASPLIQLNLGLRSCGCYGCLLESSPLGNSQMLMLS